MTYPKAYSHSDTAPTRPFFTHNPDFYNAVNKQFNDPKAYGRLCLIYLKTVVLAGVKS